MNIRDREAIAHFKEGHLNGIPKMLKATGHLHPAIHLYGRKGVDYGIGIFPVMMEGEVPIRLLRMLCDKLFDELICLSYSCEATMWKSDLKAAGIKPEEMDGLQKNDPRLLAMKKNSRAIDILWITFETDQGTDVKIYEVIKTGGSMVSVHGELADNIRLQEMEEHMDRPDGFAGRFANLFKRIKTCK